MREENRKSKFPRTPVGRQRASGSLSSSSPHPASFLKKAARIEAFVAGLGAIAGSALDPRYLAYFRCFNAGEYYDAHDVLEHLWLEEGPAGENHAFYKGLIQLAGAFVHLRKQYEHPAHPKHGRRLGPAARLFDLARANLGAYGPVHRSLDVRTAEVLCRDLREAIVASSFTYNPWSPATAPQLLLANS